MKSLPWADLDNYRISYDEQLVRVRVPDMKRFDQKQLLNAFASRNVGPALLVDVTPLQDDPVSKPAPAELQSLEGEWQTDDEAEQKLWLNIRGQRLRLHTTQPGDWISATSTILEANETALLHGPDREHAIEMKYRRVGDVLQIDVPPPSIFRGEFQLHRTPGADQP